MFFQPGLCTYLTSCQLPCTLLDVCSFSLGPDGTAVAAEGTAGQLFLGHSFHISVCQSVSSKPTSETHCAPSTCPLGPLDQHNFGRLWSWFCQANIKVMLNPNMKFSLCINLWSKLSLLEPLVVNTKNSFGQARTKTMWIFLSLPL